MSAVPMAFLPIELVLQVVAELGRPRPSAYRCSTSTVVTLCRLSLVSRSFHAMATPVLYRSVSLLGPVSMSRFARTMSTSEKRIHVRAILFDRFWEDLESIPDICTILLAVAPSLRQLFVNFPLLSENRHSEEIFRAFDKLSACNIVEFVSERQNYDDLLMRHYPMMGSHWTGLRRLALHSFKIDNHFLITLSTLPALEVVAFVFAELPYPSPSFTAPLPPSLRQVIVCWKFLGFDKLRDHVNRTGVERGAPVAVTCISPHDHAGHSRIIDLEWAMCQVTTGELWETDRYKGAVTTLC
ncbi:hypothetical protein BOTBODRAFT_406238 [Botryobasidium botryosum FD-172 SS1]|uniref:Uncharacterized protein n=1 Tax=Botryobasidium botryosum (strain FD-172 SS1) TaxID=930990 RepID=A0A067MB10_BOTB1|nr:hypothetical protein BOTBODRAFT_406238 [Botryobasidium botryosum FD-172 SS1]